jgi:arylsulfatase
MRFRDWKIVFMEQRVQGTLQVWAEPFVSLRLPKLFNLRRDPYERADITSNTYWDWLIDRAFAVYGAQMLVGEFLETFKEYPPSGKAASFTVGDALEALQTPRAN